MTDIKITKREVLVSVIIVSVMLLLGIVIHGNINDQLMLEYQKYNTALQIENDSELFVYGMKTNVGNAFVYGDLKAIDTVTYPEIGGAYSYVEKVKERYTRHTRTVTKTKTVNGKTKTYTETEVYYTWDKVDSWDKHSEKISFLEIEEYVHKAVHDLEFIAHPTLEEVIASDKKARAYVIQCVKGA